VRVIAVALAAFSAFFVFYTVRLLVVTDLLRHTRAGGGGAFIGAIVFPVLAIALGWTSRWCWRRARPARDPA
jgi:hypothetical protein